MSTALESGKLIVEALSIVSDFLFPVKPTMSPHSPFPFTISACTNSAFAYDVPKAVVLTFAKINLLLPASYEFTIAYCVVTSPL